MAPSSNNLAFTSPINPPGVTPVLTRSQVWAMLLLKIKSAETFVPQAIESTTVLSTSTDDAGNAVTEREVTFIEGARKVKETVTAYEDCRVEFEMEDGSHVSNVVSDGQDGLYLTYVFEWRYQEMEKEERDELMAKQKGISKGAVEGTVKAMRKLVEEGKY